MFAAFCGILTFWLDVVLVSKLTMAPCCLPWLFLLGVISHPIPAPKHRRKGRIWGHVGAAGGRNEAALLPAPL